MSSAPVFWFTGLSGSGKTTVAEAAKERLKEQGYSVLILDGDDVRNRLHRHLDFNEEDIKENNSLICGLCLQYREEHDIILVPIISPYAESRRRARHRLGEEFYEIFFNARLDVVAKRDTKGLYAKAGRGEMDNMIGISPSTPYQPPTNPDLVIDTATQSPASAIAAFEKFAIDKLAKKKTS
jgi:adenylyl-sulfate kinase